MYAVTFTDTDSCEVTTPDGKVLICFRANMGPGHGWHAPFVVIDGEKRYTPDCFTLKDEIVVAIRDAEVSKGGE